jgi:hypothetical protein
MTDLPHSISVDHENVSKCNVNQEKEKKNIAMYSFFYEKRGTS